MNNHQGDSASTAAEEIEHEAREAGDPTPAEVRHQDRKDGEAGDALTPNRRAQEETTKDQEAEKDAGKDTSASD
ncbi:hypothetical protein [Streptomyces sp. NPDC050504]|uniref:hypothetical protein n=1 Tax=Streptomyces sp. NPDC050504 TaxID=3365618 RepID=UPI0037ACEFAB